MQAARPCTEQQLLASDGCLLCVGVPKRCRLPADRVQARPTDLQLIQLPACKLVDVCIAPSQQHRVLWVGWRPGTHKFAVLYGLGVDRQQAAGTLRLSAHVRPVRCQCQLYEATTQDDIQSVELRAEHHFNMPVYPSIPLVCAWDPEAGERLAIWTDKLSRDGYGFRKSCTVLNVVDGHTVCCGWHESWCLFLSATTWHWDPKAGVVILVAVDARGHSTTLVDL